MDVLKVRDLAVGYREGIDILRGVNLSVTQGTITSVIGPNGAGKSTLLKCLFGLLPARAGDVVFDGQSIAAETPDRRKAGGIAYLPQHNSTFPQLTVEENLKLGGWLLRKDRAAFESRLQEIYAMFPALAERRRMKATNLSGGQLRMLSVAKEIVVRPRLLMVDEPSVGMAPKVAAELYELLVQMPGWGVTILLVDQNIDEAVRISERVYMIGEGHVQREDTGAWFASHIEDVIREMLQGLPEPAGNGIGRGELP